MRHVLTTAVVVAFVLAACAPASETPDAEQVPEAVAPTPQTVEVWEEIGPVDERYLLSVRLLPTRSGTSRSGWYQRSPGGPIAEWVLQSGTYSLSVESVPCTECELAGPEHTNGTLLDIVDNSCTVDFEVGTQPVVIEIGRSCSSSVEGAVTYATAGEPLPTTTIPLADVAAEMRALWESNSYNPYTIEIEQRSEGTLEPDAINGFISLTVEDGIVVACDYTPSPAAQANATAVCATRLGTMNTPVEALFDLIDNADPGFLTVDFGDFSGFPHSITIDDPNAVDDAINVVVVRFVGSEPTR